VVRELSELARELEAEPDFTAVMDRIVRAAVSELAGATAAAITLVQHGQVPSPAHSSELAGRVGHIQSEQAVAQSPVKLLTELTWPPGFSVTVAI
jgi:hypothetical protein